MRLKSVAMTDVMPVQRFDVENLADVVVLAGPNGVGKTRLVLSLMNAFRTPGGNQQVRLVVEATCEEEKVEWGRSHLDTSVREEAKLLAKTIQKNRRRTQWQSSVFQFESDRANPGYSPFSFSFEAADPWDEVIGWDYGLSSLRNRYQDTIASLFRKVHSLDNAIAKRGRELIKSGGGRIEPTEFPDPIEPFKQAFRQLLAPKELVDPEPREQTLYYSLGEQRYPVASLSSGEREVVNIVFDFLLRDPRDSIVIFDEPELHLHPELSYKLLHTLRNAGMRNQFVFVTHSPDIITASLEHSVVFVSPPRSDQENQAVLVREEDATNEALRLIGQSIGIVSLGKRIVLIEGAKTSLDKQTYGAILKNRFPNLVLVPSGGQGLIRTFQSVVENVLSKSLWGVEFFMLCDRDALPPSKDAGVLTGASGGRLKVLNRYHLENYLLEERVLARVFRDWEAADSWLCDEFAIRERLKEIAKSMVPYATALTVSARFREQFGNVDLMVKGCHGKTSNDLVGLMKQRSRQEADRFATSFDANAIESATRETYQMLEDSLENDTWKEVIPGKAIFEKFAHIAQIQSGRLKIRYLAEAENVSPHPFADIIETFSGFSAM